MAAFSMQNSIVVLEFGGQTQPRSYIPLVDRGSGPVRFTRAIVSMQYDVINT